MWWDFVSSFVFWKSKTGQPPDWWIFFNFFFACYTHNINAPLLCLDWVAIETCKLHTSITKIHWDITLTLSLLLNFHENPKSIYNSTSWGLAVVNKMDKLLTLMSSTTLTYTLLSNTHLEERCGGNTKFFHPRLTPASKAGGGVLCFVISDLYFCRSS